jgi:hypothetical protein
MVASLRASLAQQAANQFTAEAQVVYFLVTIRKLIELEKFANRYRSLSFFCDWVLHAELDRGGARAVLAKFEEFYATATATDWTIPPGLSDIITARAFWEELADLLALQNIEAQFLDGEAGWAPFVSLYGRVIDRCPLTLTGGSGRVRRVTVERVEVDEADRVLQGGWRCDFALQWTPELNLAPGEVPALKAFRIMFSYPTTKNATEQTSLR